MATEAVFLIGNEYRLTERSLILSKNEELVKLNPAPAKILRVLAERQCRGGEYLTAVALGELFDISPATIRTYIHRIKKAIFDDAIRMVTHDGYMLTLPVVYRHPSNTNAREEPLQRLPQSPVDLSGSATTESLEVSAKRLPEVSDSDRDLAERAYFSYRGAPNSLVQPAQLIAYLESRYKCRAIRLAGYSFPSTAIWVNKEKLISPDAVLGSFAPIRPKPLEQSATLPPEDYRRARSFVETEPTKGPKRYDGKIYLLEKFVGGKIPKVHGSMGLYYDTILTQYAIEWELNKVLKNLGTRGYDSLAVQGSLPLRESVEAQCDPRYSGAGRCASLATSTFLVFKHPVYGGYMCLVRRRSNDVAVSPGTLHVAPAGMFEARNYEPWSVKLNVWRELLEEVYSDKEEVGDEDLIDDGRLWQKKPIGLLEKLITRRSAEFSVTGICFDLLSLRHEICTVLFIRDENFYKERGMVLNWEYSPQSWENLQS